MSKSNPVIIQFEPDDNYQTVAELIGFGMGLKVVAKAHNIKSAKKLLNDIEAKQIKPDIAIVASYLQKTSKDGEKLAAKLRELLPDIRIIAYTETDDEEWGDKLAVKSGKDNTKTLVSALSELTGKEFRGSNA